MKILKNVEVAKRALLVINFMAVLFYSSVYLSATKYIIENNFSRSLLEKINIIPSSPERIFWLSNLFFIGLLLVMYVRNREFEKETKARDWLAVLKKAWLLFIVASFGSLLLSNYDVLSLLVRTPDLDVYINFFPASTRLVISFIKNGLVSLNMIVFIISLMTYIIYSVTENHKIEEELLMAAQANTRLKEYVAVSEKITEDRERRRIAREIHDTIGHALTGISAGIDAVTVLIDLDPEHAKKQLSSVSNVVREGIVDVRRSLNKMRPGALENRTLKDALEKMLSEYQELSHLQIDLNYHWDNVDFDKTKEDVIFRVIQESVTNSLRHGRATKIKISMLSESDYVLLIKDNGTGSENIKYGFGLTQMTERLAIIGGRVAFSGKDGFSTTIHIPKIQGEEG